MRKGRAQRTIEQFAPVNRQGRIFPLVGARSLGRRARHDQRDLPALEIPLLARAPREFGERPAINALVQFRELARDRRLARRPEHRSAIGEHLHDAMRRLEKHQRPRLARERVEPSAPLARLRRQKSLEAESIRRDPGHGQRRRDRGRSGNRSYLDTGRCRATHEIEARVRQQRRPGVAYERHHLAGLQTREQGLAALTLVVGMQGNQGFLQSEGGEQLSAPSGVLGGDDVGRGERIPRPRRHVGEITDGRGHHVETPARRLLVSHYNHAPCRTARGHRARRRCGIQSVTPPMVALRRLAPLALLCLGALLLVGCGANTRTPASLERAAALSARGDHVASAREYEALAAAARGSAINALLLPAAKEWLRAGNAAAAEAAIARLLAPLEIPQRDARELVLAEAALLRGEAARGWDILGSVSAPVGAARIDEYHALRQRLALATSRPLQAIRSQVDRESAATDAAALEQMRGDFLRELIAAVDRGLLLDPRVAGRDVTARGWLEAAPLAARATRASRDANAAITAAWRKRYPTHPATQALATLGQVSTSQTPLSSAAGVPAPTPVSSALLPSGRAMPRSAHVAVLLPLSGRQATAGAQVRDGLLAAYFADAETTRPPLRFYDTARQSVAEALAAATQGGATFVIGPLSRDEVVAAATSAALASGSTPTSGAAPGTGSAPPVLALNALPAGQTAPATFRQFALSPEDEARAVARRALGEGRRRAIALVPAGDWGSRVLQAFREELEAGGGALLGVETLAGRDVGNAVQSLLRLDDSLARHRRVQAAIDMPLVFQPRRRADVDLLFMPGMAATLRQWRPQLRFQGAGDIPAYATSDAFDGRAGDELQGLIFPDMDWMIAPQAPRAAALRSQLETLGNDASNRSRLFALGHDAWLLQSALRAGRSPSPAVTLDGATGALYLDAAGRVQRSLRFAQIDDGEVKLLDPSDGGG